MILGLLLFSGFFSGATYWIGIHQGKNLSPNIHNNKSSNIDIILEHLLNNYVDTLEKIKLSENSINTILKNLDPHSSYIPARKRQRRNESLVGHFGGIGIRFMIYRDTLTIVDIISGGPSESAGLEIRDRIVKINSENIAGNGLKNEDVLKKLKGKVGTKVKNIRLVEGDHNIDCKITGVGAMKLKSQFVKKN